MSWMLCRPRSQNAEEHERKSVDRVLNFICLILQFKAFSSEPWKKSLILLYAHKNVLNLIMIKTLILQEINHVR